MYLSVPLPHAMERQLNVTYVPANGEQPVKCVVSLNKQARIGKLKEELLKTLGKENIAVANIALAEVLENHISKILVSLCYVRYTCSSKNFQKCTFSRRYTPSNNLFIFKEVYLICQCGMLLYYFINLQ